MIKHAALILVVLSTPAYAREWTDSTGKYTFEANLVAFNETDLVLEKPDKTLVAVDIEQLSASDQEYLQSKEAAAEIDKLGAKEQIWKMQSGLEVVGRVVNYARRDVTFSMSRGKIYVNDHLFENLPDIYQKIAAAIAAHFTERDITDRKGLFDWLKRRKGEPITFTCEGVQMELENGNMYGVPFFLFSDAALAALKSGWDEWSAQNATYDTRQETALRLQTQAQSFQQNQADAVQLLKMQLQMQAYDAGMFNLWEVTLYPGPGTGGWPQYVVVPGNDSRQAGLNALEKNPGYRLGPISKVARRY